MNQNETARSCERSDRILRAALGETAARTMLRFGPVLALLVLAAAVASIVG